MTKFRIPGLTPLLYPFTFTFMLTIMENARFSPQIGHTGTNRAALKMHMDWLRAVRGGLEFCIPINEPAVV